ncbi:MAG: DsrE/DsrF/DrsH-like family protein [Thermodesulfobacteriota bacterium]
MANKATLLVFNNEFDRAFAAFRIAIAAAHSKMEVMMVFTLWGIDIVKKDGPLFRGKGFKSRMMNFMNRGGAKRLKLSRMHMGGMGKWMMEKMMKDKNIQPLSQLIADAKKLGVKFLICDVPLEMMGLTKDDLIDEVDNIVNVETYIQHMADSQINLFV